jgi:hypothetical protein
MNMDNFKKAGVVTLIIVALILIAMGAAWKGLLGKNDDQNFQVRQTVGGDMIIQDRGGYYGQFFNTIWTYPRVQEAFFSADVSGKEGDATDDSVRVTFNDGGMANVSCFVRWQNPTAEDMRTALHRAFSGNAANIESAVRSALINVCKNTAPLMSASQHQSARKAEFAQLVEQQLRTGIYEMRRIERTFQDKTDENGKPITIEVTEIVKGENNMPVIAQESPLKKYGLIIQQFSITGTNYDEQTRKQFAAKKDAFLKAELSKSQKEEEVQKRLQVVEQGLREKAEMEAKMNVEKAQAVISAEKEKEVAEQQKLQAEVKAQQLLAVAEIEKKEAQVQLDKAKLDAEALIELAKAKQQQIELSGAITEQEQILAEIKAKRDISVAEHLANIKVPHNVITGGGSGDNGGSMTSNLMNILLLKHAGILKDDPRISVDELKGAIKPPAAKK